MPGIADMLGISLRTLDIALLMCCDEKPEMVTTNGEATQYKLLHICLDSRHGHAAGLAVATTQWGISGLQAPATVIEHSCSRHFPYRKTVPLGECGNISWIWLG